MKVEAKWNTTLNQYLRETRFYCYYELKQTNGNSLPFSAIEDVQWEGLQATEKEGLVWKLSDEDQRQKPCDGFSTNPLPSYLIIKFPDAFYFIRFRDIVMMKENGKASITLEEAKKRAEKIIRLNLKK